MIRHNWFYKLLALAVAIGLWGYVNSERNPQARKTVTVSVEARNLAKGFAPELSAGEVSVRIEGLKSVVDVIRKDDVSAWVDLKGMKASNSPVEKNRSVNVAVTGVPMDEISYTVAPSSVKVRVEALSGKRLPVELKPLSAPPLGYAFGDPTITPASVSVSGKATEVTKVKRVVLAFPGGEVANTLDDYFSVTPLDEKGNVVTGVSLQPDRVRLKLDLVEVPATKTVIVSPTIVGEPRFPAQVSRISVSPSSVVIEGKPTALVGISTINTETISIEGAEETISKEVSLRVPPGVDLETRRVRVIVHVVTPD